MSQSDITAPQSGTAQRHWYHAVDWSEIALGTLCIVTIWLGIRDALELAALALLIAGVERVAPYRRNLRVLGNAWRTDVFHAVLTSGAAAFLTAVLVVVCGSGMRNLIADHAAFLYAQPTWALVVESVVLADLAMYGQHRLMHRFNFLWRIHSVHHSIEGLNWLSSFRVHPFDKATVNLFAFLPLYVLGTYSWPALVAAATIVESLNSPWAHGNLKVSLGPFWWLIRNPEFHRWHHSRSRTAQNSNFSQTFPIWDVIFGTVYMPRDRQPEAFGLVEPISPNYLDQIFDPLFPPKARDA